MSSSLHPLFEDGPFHLIATPRFKTGKDDKFTICASEMAVLHNAFMRGFNSIYNQALEVQPQDYKPFLCYAQCIYECIDVHHSGEETTFFPGIEEATGIKGIMDVNIAQHEVFHSGLHAYGDYIASFIKGSRPINEFSGQHLRELIDAFAEPLNQHLHDEIPTLLALEKYSDKLDIKALFDKDGEEHMAKLSKTRIFPAFLMNDDTTYEGGINNFPPIPGFVKWVFMNIISLWHWRWWAWTSCDKSGRLKPVKNVKI